MGVGVVVLEIEVFEGEGIDVADIGVDDHGGERPQVAGELEFGLLEVVGVEVEVAEAVDEVAGFVVEGLGNHHREQCVAGDVEGDAEEEVGAALVELAGESGAPAFVGGFVDVELEEEVAGREGHFIDLADVPCRNEVTAGVWIVCEGIHQLGNLVDGGAVVGLPGAPLLAVDGAEFAVFVGPIVPDADAVFLEVGDVGVAFEEPEEFVDDGSEVDLLGGEGGEAFAKVVAGLTAEDGKSSGAGAVGAFFAVLEDVPEEVEVLLHGLRLKRREPRVKAKEEGSGDRDGHAPGLVVALWFAAELLFLAVLAFEADSFVALAAGLAAFLAANFLAGLLLGGFFPEGNRLELFTKRYPSVVAVHGLGAVLLAFDFDAGGFVLQVDAGGGFVDLLTAVSGATDEFFDEVVVEDAELFHADTEFSFFGGAEHWFSYSLLVIRNVRAWGLGSV